MERSISTNRFQVFLFKSMAFSKTPQTWHAFVVVDPKYVFECHFIHITNTKRFNHVKGLNAML